LPLTTRCQEVSLAHAFFYGNEILTAAQPPTGIPCEHLCAEKACPSCPRFEPLDRFPAGPQDGGAVATEPAIQESGIHPSEVGVELEVIGRPYRVPGVVQVRQARVPPHNGTFDRRAGYEQTRRRTVIRAATTVLMNAAAKFRKGHEPHAAVVAGG